MIIIGLTGRNAGGKTTAGETLKAKGFYYLSLSDVIRQEARTRGLSEVRENLIALGNELRERHGPGAKVAVLPFARYQLPKNAVRMEPADERVFAYAGHAP